MTIALRAVGTATSGTAAVTAVNPAVPTGATTGDLSVLSVWAKPYNTTITTPAGWTKIGEATNGTTAAGTDTGSTIVAVYVKESATVGAIGNIGQTNANTMGAVITTYSKTSGTWDFAAFTSGGDTTNAANYSATGAAGIGVATGDWVCQSTAINGDVGTLSAPALGGMSGATLGTYVSRRNQPVTTGTDTRGYIGDIPITAGSSTAAPTFAYTNVSSGSGTTMFLRLRETSSGAATGSAIGTTTFTGTATGTRTPKGSGTGTATWTGTATGSAPAIGGASGSGAGSTTWTGTATGLATQAGSGTGDTLWTGTATGSAPSIGGSSGSAAGTTTWTGTATGATVQSGSCAGLTTWTGAAAGIRASAGSAVGSAVWTGIAGGMTPAPSRDLAVTVTGPTGSALTATLSGHPLTTTGPTAGHPMSVTGPVGNPLSTDGPTGHPLSVTGPRS